MNTHATDQRGAARAAMESCAHICHECQDECMRLVPHCLSIGGRHAEREHICLLLDCIDVCGTAHALLHRGSAHHRETCRACAVICEACAADCRRLAGGDRAMERCADTCTTCAASCRKMEANGG